MKKYALILIVFIVSACSEDEPIISSGDSGLLKKMKTYSDESSILYSDYYYLNDHIEQIELNGSNNFHIIDNFIFDNNEVVFASGVTFTYDQGKIVAGTGFWSTGESYHVVFEYPNAQTVIKKDYVSNILFSHYEYVYDANNNVVESKFHNLNDSSISISNYQYNNNVDPEVAIYPVAFRKAHGMSNHLQISKSSDDYESTTEYIYYSSGSVKKATTHSDQNTRYAEYYYY